MSAIATAFVALRADASRLAGDVRGSLAGPMSAEATSMGTHLRSAMSLVGQQIGGEIGEITRQVSQLFDAAGSDGSRMAKRLGAVGGVGVGLGMGLQAVASKETEAGNQLDAAVKATGKGYDEFGAQVDAAVSKQIGFGNSGVDVKRSLQILTQSYGDPKKALDELGLVTDLAAAKHIDLTAAAEMVAKAHGGGREGF